MKQQNAMNYISGWLVAILLSVMIVPSPLFSQCVPPQPQNAQAVVDGSGNVVIDWSVPCPTNCTNGANTSILFFIGFYSQQSPAPNGLNAEYGFTTFVDVNCPFTEMWDGQLRDSTSTADQKESECISLVLGQEVNASIPGYEASFSLQDICNNNYGFGPGVMRIVFPAFVFCSGVTYDLKIWSIEVNVLPNGNITNRDIACSNLYLNESAPVVVPNVFTYPGVIAPIASPQIIVSGSSSGNGTYTGTTNRVVVDCIDTFSFDYLVTPGCNYTESVAAYFNISAGYTYGNGIVNPGDWGLGVEDWYIFFANNIVNSSGQPVPYVGTNAFASFTVSDDVEVCILTQDPCNGSSAVTCIQFEVLGADTAVVDFDYNLTTTIGCDSFEVTFSNLSTGASAYFWDFGDGASVTSSDTSLVHTFQGGGPFQVTVQSVIIGGCSAGDTMTQMLSFTPVIDTADIDFNYSSVLTANCDSLVVNFSAIVSGNATVAWDFDNGTTGTGLNTSAVYVTPGTYVVTAIATTNSSCLLPDTLTRMVVFTPPTDTAIADFGFTVTSTNGCDSNVVVFNNQSFGATIYTWTLPDTVIVMSSNGSVQNEFVGSGPFVIELIAEAGVCGVGDTITDTLFFPPMIDTLSVDFVHTDTYSANCDSLIVAFTSSVSGAGTYLWDFGNGVTSILPNPTITYANPGSFLVTLTVTATDNCSFGNSVTHPVTFTPTGFVAIADFTYQVVSTNDCDSFVVQFTNQSIGGTSYFWDFGNGITSTDTHAVVTYAAGSFTAILQVNDSRNCSTNDTTLESLLFTPVVVTPHAEFAYTITQNCDEVSVTITNMSNGSNSYVWTIDGGQTNQLPGTLVFASASDFQVAVVAEGQNSCSPSDTFLQEISVSDPYGYPSVDFDFVPLDPMLGEVVAFSNLSRGTDSSRFQWSFGDGTIGSTVNPTHVYQTAGTYQICLYGENQFSCPDSACKQLEIEVVISDTVYVELPTAFTPNGDNRNDVFMVRENGAERIHLMIFNRWGELVFESRDPSIGWDGTYKGEPQEMEVYDWLLNASLQTGGSVFKKGNVTLLR